MADENTFPPASPYDEAPPLKVVEGPLPNPYDQDRVRVTPYIRQAMQRIAEGEQQALDLSDD
ncbi:MAG: hypothetical protein AAFV59_07455 [Pseudomonadota bacterium]